MKQSFDLYKQYFNTSPDIVVDTSTGLFPKKQKQEFTIKGGRLLGTYNGQEVFLPMQIFKDKSNILDLVCCTVRITSKKNIIRTPLYERKGTVKELFNIGEYIYTIKGILIGKNHFPDDQILMLKEFYESADGLELYCALTELFSDPSRRIIITSLEFPEVQGKDYRHRPFVIECEQDYTQDSVQEFRAEYYSVNRNSK